MKGYAFIGEREVALIEKPTPKPGPGEVLIKTRTSSICGSDLHRYRRSHEERKPFASTYSGHEPVGDVVAVGDGVLWPHVGDRVVGYHIGGCGDCNACLVRDFKRCPRTFDDEFHIMQDVDGSNADYFLTAAGQVLPLPDEFTYVEGSVLCCNFGTAWSAVQKAVDFPRGTLAVWGLGPVGLNVILIARAIGLKVVGIDLSPSRRALAEGLGAETLDGNRKDLIDALKRASTYPDGPESIIDTTGVEPVQRLLVNAVRIGGTIVLVGLGDDTFVGPAPAAILRQVTIKGSWIFEVEDWPLILEFVSQHKVDLLQAIDGVRPISEFIEAYEDADAARVGKIVFNWG